MAGKIIADTLETAMLLMVVRRLGLIFFQVVQLETA
jgi:hypothetical protein